MQKNSHTNETLSLINNTRKYEKRDQCMMPVSFRQFSGVHPSLRLGQNFGSYKNNNLQNSLRLSSR
jgi:hypothetical protein